MVVRRISNDELYHHGVKGQRWGVRRYQNADGSLTAAGKAQYNVTSNGRVKYSTGKSKGVHKGKKITSPSNSPHPHLENLDSFEYAIDPSLKPNQIGYSKKKDHNTEKVSFQMTFKDQNAFDNWYKSAGLADYNLEDGDEARQAGQLMDYTIGMLENHGTLEFNPNATNVQNPLGVYTNLTDEEYVTPGLAYYNNFANAEDEGTTEEDDNKPSSSKPVPIAEIKINPLRGRLLTIKRMVKEEISKQKIFSTSLKDLAVYGFGAPQAKIGKAIALGILRGKSGAIYMDF